MTQLLKRRQDDAPLEPEPERKHGVRGQGVWSLLQGLDPRDALIEQTGQFKKCCAVASGVLRRQRENQRKQRNRIPR